MIAEFTSKNELHGFLTKLKIHCRMSTSNDHALRSTKISRNNNVSIEICYVVLDMRKCHHKENNYFYRNNKLKELNKKGNVSCNIQIT
ncbi:hypothetical protein H5410_059848 [Solanum commersonii]|uniref:Uncharacterized protein n=1 Tax=Solanum commersonii TaxID=4109 RepID=A0A9J5W3M1_SOLCO|nr:hypothetical protein H5410_059848 [Solanum commersonii]